MKKVIRAYLDRIEENMGVLYLGKDESHKITLPLEFLPNDVSEGDIFNLTINKNISDKTEKEVDELRKLLENNG